MPLLFYFVLPYCLRDNGCFLRHCQLLIVRQNDKLREHNMPVYLPVVPASGLGSTLV